MQGVVSARSLSSWLACGVALTGSLLLVLPSAVRLASRPSPRPLASAAPAAMPGPDAHRQHETVAAFAARALPNLVQITGNMRCGDAEMGADLLAVGTGSYGMQGPRDNADPHFAHRGPGEKVPAPTAYFGREHALGTDEQNALGRMWGEQRHNQSGELGLGRRGTPGGVAKSIDVAPQLAASSPGLRVVHTGLRVTGPRKPSEIGRAMAAHFEDFRRCATDVASTEARSVELDFEVAADGRASAIGSAGGPLEQCLERSLARLELTSGSAAVARVVYPLHFVPGSAGVPAAPAAHGAAAEACDCGG